MSEPPSSANSRRTIEAYDDHAADYAKVTAPGRSPYGFGAVERFCGIVGAGAHVLELASGPGWDADAMESHGLQVRRTDASEGFIAVQAERGKRVERLDMAADDLGGPWDGVVALYVLQHIERDGVAAVIDRIVAALKPGGVFLTSFQEGTGELEQQGAEGGVYHVVQWPPADMLALMARAGLELVWRHSFQGDPHRWSLLIARRS